VSDLVNIFRRVKKTKKKRKKTKGIKKKKKLKKNSLKKTAYKKTKKKKQLSLHCGERLSSCNIFLISLKM